VTNKGWPTRILQDRHKPPQIKRRRKERRWGKRRAGGYTAHVGELAEGVGVHLGAQPQKSADDRRRRWHPAPWSPLLSGRTGGVVAVGSGRRGPGTRGASCFESHVSLPSI
jgi:hypothetical protein